MTVREARERLRAMAHQTVSGDELRAILRGLYARSGAAEVERLLADAHYWRIARARGGITEPDAAFLNRMRRDYAGPVDLEGIDLSHAASMVVLEEGAERQYIAESAAIPAIIRWLIDQMAKRDEAPTEGVG